ncbi:like-Sm ribonucleoprotein [Cystobasidium minutum MCA 4210]|uniref:like-Sm ribonucleoprotein n=1 Tax=Cystobasidium minutum MCA 4210 TaxID=1397322 RepID=UPI0034CF4FE6|eukprot:jgi/Rhomi1/165013/fgenesh1_kg.1_\
MAKPANPELKKFMDKRLLINVQGGRKVTGILRGFDIFLNLVLDEARDETYPGQEQNMFGGSTIIRGNSVSSIEVLSA